MPVFGGKCAMVKSKPAFSLVLLVFDGIAVIVGAGVHSVIGSAADRAQPSL